MVSHALPPGMRALRRASVNLPPGMLRKPLTLASPDWSDLRAPRRSIVSEFHASNEPLELAGTEPVEQEPWQEFGMGGGDSPLKYKYVPLHEGHEPEDTLYFEAAPQVRIYTPEKMRTRVRNNLDWPHHIEFKRGPGEEGASSGSYDITHQGKAGKVLSHAVHAIRELAKEYRPMDMHFTAVEDSRLKAYTHLMHRLAADPEVNRDYVFLTRPGTASRPDSGSFHIVHKAVAHLPEYQGMLPVTKHSKASPAEPEHRPSNWRDYQTIPAGAPFSNLPPGMRAIAG